MVDMRLRFVRYLAGALTDEETDAIVDRVLVPIGIASRTGDRRAITLRALSSSQLWAAPRLSNRPVTRAGEDATLGVYGLGPPLRRSPTEPSATPLFPARPPTDGCPPLARLRPRPRHRRHRRRQLSAQNARRRPVPRTVHPAHRLVNLGVRSLFRRFFPSCHRKTCEIKT